MRIARSEPENLKVTSRIDLELAELLLSERRAMTVQSGIGYDCHPFAPGRRLVLGGVELPAEAGLAGHSDADVLTHAIIDALLGAAGLADIGHQFPDTDERYRDADSIELLRTTVAMLRERSSRSCTSTRR